MATTDHPHHRPSPPGRASGTLLPLPLTLTLSLSLPLTLTLTLTLTRLCRPRVGRVFVEIGLTFTLFEQAPLPPTTYAELTSREVPPPNMPPILCGQVSRALNRHL